MKIRTEFVTNSSAASFIILRKYLTDAQVTMILNHIEVGTIIAEKKNVEMYKDPWSIKVDDDLVEGDTSMDNFDMYWFLKEIGVKEENIRYESFN